MGEPMTEAEARERLMEPRTGAERYIAERRLSPDFATAYDDAQGR